MSSSCEYSGTQAVATALGLKANWCFHNRCYLYSDQAMDYVTDMLSRINNPNSEFPDETSETSSFSSGIYSDDSEAESSNSDLNTSQTRNKLQDKHSTMSAPQLSQEEEFGPGLATDDMILSDTDSDVDAQTHQRVECLLRRGTIRHGSVQVTQNTTGKLLIVTQAEDYHFRPLEFKSFSLYEMVCTSYRREISRKVKEPSSSDSTSSESDSDDRVRKQRAGRQQTQLFHFQDQHPLHETHALALLRKYSVAQFIRKVPAFPGPRPDPLTDAWKTLARAWALFSIVVFKPWDGPHGLPESTTWKTFCDWQVQLRQSKTVIDRTRAAFIVNCSHNLKFSSRISKILKHFRGSAATRWLEMAAHLRPKRWLFTDESPMEKDLKSKNTQREAQLAMQDLLHKVCNCSPAETKKMELLRSTVQSYIQAMAPCLTESQNYKSLFQNIIPVLSERIDCFPLHQVQKVHEHNLKQIRERILAEKLNQSTTNQTKRKRNNPPMQSPPPREHPVAWSPQQHAIIQSVAKFLDTFIDWKNGNTAKPKSLNLLIFGGPGCTNYFGIIKLLL
jgi:hypothetical protein